MAPLILEGETLGQRHHHYNKLVAAAVADQATELLPLNYDDADVDNLLKIDVACSRRNVEYILDVLQSDDMLYVSRAIKQSTWLITDDQYVHIINPEYLNNELFPKMTTKAKNKLLLAIRLNLKNESRVDEFFKYYMNDKIIDKWLPNCSQATMEKFYSENAHTVTADVFKRLCENSITFLKILLKLKGYHYIADQLAVSKILINKYADEYLEIMKDLGRHNMPAFGIRATRQIMHHCPEKVLNDFEKFAHRIHLPTFAKCLKKENVQEFLIKQSENQKLKNWFKYENLKHFVKYLPVETRFDFIKKLFIDKETPKPNKPGRMMEDASMMQMACSVKCSAPGPSTNASIYRWYRFATFDAAFVDLKKLIRVESSPAERNAILTVLINCAKRNPAHVKTLLQFYREKHMNEPFKFKIQFVNTFVSVVDTHKFDVSTWAILNDIFSSMEVYIESEHCVPYCVKAIIVYKLLHNENIPEIIEKKHAFDTFKEYRNKLEEKDRKVIFTYLFNLEMYKLNKQTINNEIEMTMAFDLLGNVLNLLKEWKMKLSDYPLILEKIRHIIKIKREKSLTNNLSFIYHVEKKWRRELFEDSLFLNQGDETCLHALKHDPGLLLRFHTEVAAMCSNDTVSLKHTLSKLRIYWTQSLAPKWSEIYHEGLSKATGHKATIEGICILLPRKQLQSLLAKYAPVETKIDWSNTDSTLLGLQKNIAKRMQLIRPSINLEAVLSYAKNDYLQYALPSLNAVLYNMSATQVLTYIPILFDSPVSLKKHAVRLAYTKLKFSEIKELVENMWKDTKNSSIKTVLFKETYELLKKAKKGSTINELWQLLSMFIDNLTPDENRVIYDTLAKVENVPMAVRPQFFMKSYMYLTSLPAKANCESHLKRMVNHAPAIMNLLEPTFVETILLKPIPELVRMMTDKSADYNGDLNSDISILASYIMDSENEEIQYNRYEKYLIPILDGCFGDWKYTDKGIYVIRNNCSMLLNELVIKFKACVLKKYDLYMKTLKDIEKRLKTLPLEENYCLINCWTMGTLLVEAFITYMKDHPKSDVESALDLEQFETMARSETDTNNMQKEFNKKWDELCFAVGPLFGKLCLNFIKNDIISQRPALVKYFVKSLTDVFEKVEFSSLARLNTVKSMLDSDVVATYLIVLKITHSSTCYQRDEELTKLRKEIYDIIMSHPSTDVQIHYHETKYSYPHAFEAIPY